MDFYDIIDTIDNEIIKRNEERDELINMLLMDKFNTKLDEIIKIVDEYQRTVDYIILLYKSHIKTDKNNINFNFINLYNHTRNKNIPNNRTARISYCDNIICWENEEYENYIIVNISTVYGVTFSIYMIISEEEIIKLCNDL